MCPPLLDTPRFFLENQPANHFKNLSRLDFLKLFRKQVWIPPEVQGNRLYSGEIHFRFFHEKTAGRFSNKKCSQKNSLSQLTNHDNVKASGRMLSAPTRTEQKKFLHNIAYSVYNLHMERCGAPLQLFENQYPYGECKILRIIKFINWNVHC